LLVVGSLFFFGIKYGIGVEDLSQFLKALRLGLHMGCSPSALDHLKQQMKETIAAYEVTQAGHCQPHEGQGICVGADEVFFGLLVLVLAELASSYVLTEVQLCCTAVMRPGKSRLGTGGVKPDGSAISW